VLAVYLWLAAVTGARRGELCGLQWSDVDLDSGVLHIAYSYLVRAGYKLRKDTKTHQDRRLAIDRETIAVLSARRQQIEALLASNDLRLASTAYVFSNNPAGDPATGGRGRRLAGDKSHPAGPARAHAALLAARSPAWAASWLPCVQQREQPLGERKGCRYIRWPPTASRVTNLSG
jgi:hypothetical protein